MIPLGLTAAELPLFHAALTRSHTFTLDVDVLDMEQKPVSSLSPVVTDGQVNLSDDGEVTRSLSMTFLDPTRSLQLDSDSPSDGALYADRMISVRHSIRVPELGRSVSVPVFCGPLVKFDRTGSEVSVEAQGKESLAKDDVPTLVCRAGMLTVDAIRTILSERCGETFFAFPANVRARLGKDVTVGEADELRPWVVCLALAKSLGMQLFYDGAGTCRLRKIPVSPVFELLADADGANITAPVAISHDFTEIRNRVLVTGAPGITAVATAPASHPLSPTRLGRNGVPRRKTLFYEDDKLTSRAAAQAVANRELGHYLAETIGVSCSIVPAMHLDVLDLGRITTRDFAAEFRLRSASMPLGTGGDMTIGWQTRVSRPRERIRLV
ncbi:MAG: hypothetical protein ACR2JO_08105 [Mycobacteriales bacterium]